MNNRLTDTEDRSFGAYIACGALFLGAPSFFAIVLLLSLLDWGVSPQLIEKGMVWLSVPWFAFCYWLCKAAHGVKLYVADGKEKPIKPSAKH